MPIAVTATAPAGAILVHQVQATATNVQECITLWAHGNATAVNVNPVIQVTNGATVSISHTIVGGQSTQRSPTLIFNQMPLSGTDTAVHLYATEGSTFFTWGHVDRIATG